MGSGAVLPALASADYYRLARIARAVKRKLQVPGARFEVSGSRLHRAGEEPCGLCWRGRFEQKTADRLEKKVLRYKRVAHIFKAMSGQPVGAAMTKCLSHFMQHQEK
jgi:hypothetical protein